MRFAALTIGLAAVLNLAMSAWEQIGHSVPGRMIVAAAAVTAWGVLWHKVIKPSWWTLRQIDGIWKAVRPLPDWVQSVERRLGEGDDRFETIEGQLGLMARVDKQRVVDALERSEEPPRRPADGEVLWTIHDRDNRPPRPG